MGGAHWSKTQRGGEREDVRGEAARQGPLVRAVAYLGRVRSE